MHVVRVDRLVENAFRRTATRASGRCLLRRRRAQISGRRSRPFALHNLRRALSRRGRWM